ncbi:DUF1730 domain-containing protein [Mycoplasmatota bacterium zrk1]
MLKNRIKKYAEELGLLIGFCSYNKYKELNDSRFNSNSLEFAKSIISVGLPISRNDDELLASFALDKDYHIVLREKLSELKEYIFTQIDAKIEYFVDNGPVNEKLVAYLSGIGYFGKNSLIINELYGSYILLGELFTDIEFKSDFPVLNDCKNCSICMTHCPSEAIGNIYEKCISGYLQRKDVFPDRIYQVFNNIYGCDICISNCPKNKAVKSKKKYVFENLNLKDIIECSKSDFKKYSNCAFYWLGHNLMKRNAIIVAANKGINIDKELKYVHSKEDYILAAIDYYKRKSIR